MGFSYRFEAPGDHTMEIRVEGDSLDVDNHRWLAVPVKQYVHVLCVDGSVRRVKPAEFQKQLQKTREWLQKRAK